MKLNADILLKIIADRGGGGGGGGGGGWVILDEITHPCHNVKSGLIKPSLTLGCA